MIPSNDGIENIEPVLVKNKELMNTPENYYYKIKRVKSVRSKNDTMAQAGDLLKKLKNSVIETSSSENSWEQVYGKFSDLVLEKLRKLIKK